ncbi:hypothetical protein Pint_24096 [Pistacia integerrima]|uniref:Uncharacterized protein n=1 Tax=Pistacia integerrima TaxID=434235 RepID=A0ACC0YJS9_9ROSI|nr:hypothetical protein Pint_24096 [Pistacia integerrima]
MRSVHGSFLLLFLLVTSVACVEYFDSTSLNRKSFPDGFVFGTSSSAYQYEGAANKGGRGPSIWDTFVQNYPDKIKDHSSGVVAVDFYNRYKEDVAIMKEMGFDAYRFSISWSRLLPRGKLSGGLNPEGITYYNSLINELLSNGLQPFVTLFHWDVPQALEDEYGGFMNPQIVNDFQDYAELCYRLFGGRVKNWITLNEPLTFASIGYSSGAHAPGRCSKWFSPNCSGGDSATEPYIVGHNSLLAHAAAVKVYRTKYQMSQKGQIGIALNSIWAIPLTESNADRNAASRVLSFLYDWFLEPLNSGFYPSEMVTYVQERMLRFTKEQSLTVKGSFDFLGLNYYSANYAADAPCLRENPSYLTDFCVQLSFERKGIPIGPKAASDWLYVYPEGIQEVLLYTKKKLNKTVIYITENGVDELNDGKLSLEDNMRIDYYSRHLSYVQSAIKKGVNVRGYFAWSLLDNFEWGDGYTVRFGIVYVDYKHNLKRGQFKGYSLLLYATNTVMAIERSFLVLQLLALFVAIASGVKSLNPSSFPPEFLWDAGSAAYQYEGATNKDGRGPSIWDTFTHNSPERIADRSNGDVAVDFYHRYKEDVKIMKEMNTDAFRFSISWSRLLPRGVNKEGVKFYNNLINQLLSNGLQPFVTIFQWDVPQALEDEYGGFLSPRIVDDFRDFSEVCFKEFGDRVKHWITINEPWTFSATSYDLGKNAPGRCSKWVNGACKAGNTASEPYIVGHHLLLSHSASVKL